MIILSVVFVYQCVFHFEWIKCIKNIIFYCIFFYNSTIRYCLYYPYDCNLLCRHWENNIFAVESCNIVLTSFRAGVSEYESYQHIHSNDNHYEWRHLILTWGVWVLSEAWWLLLRPPVSTDTSSTHSWSQAN